LQRRGKARLQFFLERKGVRQEKAENQAKGEKRGQKERESYILYKKGGGKVIAGLVLGI